MNTTKVFDEVVFSSETPEWQIVTNSLAARFFWRAFASVSRCRLLLCAYHRRLAGPDTQFGVDNNKTTEEPNRLLGWWQLFHSRSWLCMELFEDNNPLQVL
uniref:Uncharacterized protein n=1 Tax=Plectus sambesii TaxID=2011161 RepID=A0A914WCS7_9BILA